MAKARTREIDKRSSENKEELLTAANVRQLFDYDPYSGTLAWRDPPWPGAKRSPGARAGYRRKDGYLFVKYRGKFFAVHRVIWLWVHGRWPRPTIDHIDRNKSNNVLHNLREATRLEQTINRGLLRSNSLGVMGVRRHGNRFCSRIKVEGRYMWLGTFRTIDEASAAYVRASRLYFGDFSPTRNTK